MIYALHNYFSDASYGMTWQECLDLGPTRLSRILGCSVTTASSWIHRSGPPEWQRDIFAEFISRKIKAEKKTAKG